MAHREPSGAHKARSPPPTVATAIDAAGCIAAPKTQLGWCRLINRPSKAEHVFVLEHLPVTISGYDVVLLTGRLTLRPFSLALVLAFRPVTARFAHIACRCWCRPAREGIDGFFPRSGLGRANGFDAATEVVRVQLVVNAGYLLLHVTEGVKKRGRDVEVERASGFHGKPRTPASRALGEHVAPTIYA